MNNIFLDILLFFYHNLSFNNLGITIIEIAVLTRVIFFPMMRKQMHTTKKMNEIQPLLKALQVKHKDNKQALYQAQMDLYKEHGVNPAAGCLPMVVQIVVLFGLLGAMNEILKMNVNTRFLIWDMAKPDAWKVQGISFLLPGVLVFVAALTQFIQTAMMMPVPPKVRKEDKPAEKEEKEDFTQSFTQAQSSMIWMFPLIFLFFGTQWPAGLALYWSVSSILTIAQQYPVTGLGLLRSYIDRIKRVT